MLLYKSAVFCVCAPVCRSWLAGNASRPLPPKHNPEREMTRRSALLVFALLAEASAFQLRPCAGRSAAARPLLAQPPRILLSEEANERPSLPSPFAEDDTLIQFSTLSKDYQTARAPVRGTRTRASEPSARPTLRRWPAYPCAGGARCA